MKLSTIVCSVIMVALLGAFLIAPVYADQQLDDTLNAPEVILKSPSGESVPLSSYIGKKPVLLVFWASWCTICKEEIPRLRTLNGGQFKVIAVNEGESAWKTKRYVSANNIDYQIALDPDGSVAKAFQVPGVPACVILGTSGQIVYRGFGLPENFESYVHK
jgi:peroxiredoxin